MTNLVTFETMGTIASIRAGGQAFNDGLVWQMKNTCQLLDDTFSLYKEHSEISRIARKELTLPAASELMLEEYARAISWREATDGAFTPHRPDGVLDLSGTIKAVAIQRLRDLLSAEGYTDFSVNIAGDLTVAGNQDPGTEGWSTGVVDPLNRGQLLTVLHLTDSHSSLATSGIAERGEHIWMRPETTKDFIQATVLASDIITADVMATAIISGGQTTLDNLTDRFPIGVLTVARDGSLQSNGVFQELVAR